MLDEQDIQVLSKLIDEKIAASEVRMTTNTDEKIIASESRMVASMDEKISASESRMMARMEEMISASESRTMAHVDERVDAAEARMLVMMESFFTPKFNLLADSIALLHKKLAPKEAVEDLEDRVDVLEAAVKHHSQEITELKKAQ